VDDETEIPEASLASTRPEAGLSRKWPEWSLRRRRLARAIAIAARPASVA
jgi:hypothetical protein